MAANTSNHLHQRALLKLEQARFKFEKTRLYLERWKIDLQPLYEGRLLTRKLAHEYAKLAIQTMYYLNAGALAAFPALATSIHDLSFSEYASVGIDSFIYFAVGLGAAAGATIFAYLTLEGDNRAVWYNIEATKAHLNHGHLYPNQPSSIYTQNKDKHGSTRDKFALAGFIFNILGMLFVVISLACFLRGTYKAANAFYSIAQTKNASIEAEKKIEADQKAEAVKKKASKQRKKRARPTWTEDSLPLPYPY